MILLLLFTITSSSDLMTTPITIRPIQESDFVKSLFKNEYSAISKNKQPLVVYGAGSAGQEIAECLSLHGLEVEFFCDKNPIDKTATIPAAAA